MNGPCGHAERVWRTDGLSGWARAECARCDRLEAVAARRASFDKAAFARIAELAGLTVAQLRRKLRIPTPGSFATALAAATPADAGGYALHGRRNGRTQ